MDIILGPCGEASRRVRSPYATSELLTALGRDRSTRGGDGAGDGQSVPGLGRQRSVFARPKVRGRGGLAAGVCESASALGSEAADSCELRCRGCDGATAQHSSRLRSPARSLSCRGTGGVAVVGTSGQASQGLEGDVSDRREAHDSSEAHERGKSMCFLAPSTPSTVLM